MQMPTRLLPGKAARTGKQSTHAPVRSAGVLDTARWKGDAGHRGRPAADEGRGLKVASGGGGGSRPRRRGGGGGGGAGDGVKRRWRRGNAGGGRGPDFWLRFRRWRG